MATCLARKFMKPLGIGINRLSRDLHVPPNWIHTTLRLGTYFGVIPEMWLNLQSEYALRIARRTAGGEMRQDSPQARSRVRVCCNF